MSSLVSLSDQIHARAMSAAARFRTAEAELIEILQQVEEHRVFLRRGHASLFAYGVSELGLSGNTLYCLITVARKAREVPQLKTQLETGALTLSNARRISAVITPENQKEWIEKATRLSHRQLEKEIVRIKPAVVTPERVAYVLPDRIRLEMGLSEKEILRLRRVQDLLSQSRRRAVTLEETIEALTSEYLRRHDPVEKAKRYRVRTAPTVREPSVREPSVREPSVREPSVREPSVREPSVKNTTSPVGELVTLRVASSQRIPLRAAIEHEVNARDQGRCTETLPDGRRCNQTRWIEIHHRVPVSEGGTNSPENLTTLCSAHHRRRHLRD